MQGYCDSSESPSIHKETTFVLSGATASTVVWDVTNPANIGRIEGSFANGTYTFTIPAGELREFVDVYKRQDHFCKQSYGNQRMGYC